MRRRTLLALPALGLVPPLLSACSEESAVSADTTPDDGPAPVAEAGEGAETGRLR